MAGIKLTGGTRIGQTYLKALRASSPFASLQVDEKQIVLRVLWMNHRYLKDEITRLSRYAEPFGTSLRIEHNVSSEAPFVLFKPPNYAALAQTLTELGYPIEDNQQNVN
jgi:hypothetical protein